MLESVYRHSDEYYYDLIRNNMKEFRRQYNLTQQQLADLAGISRQYICDVESKNRNKHVTIAILGRIADALDLDITEFFKKN